MRVAGIVGQRAPCGAAVSFEYCARFDLERVAVSFGVETDRGSSRLRRGRERQGERDGEQPCEGTECSERLDGRLLLSTARMCGASPTARGPILQSSLTGRGVARFPDPANRPPPRHCGSSWGLTRDAASQSAVAGSADKAPSRSYRTRSSRRRSGAAALCSWRIRSRTGRHQEASSPAC